MTLASVGDNPRPQLDNANIHKSDTDKKSAAASTEGNLNMSGDASVGESPQPLLDATTNY